MNHQETERYLKEQTAKFIKEVKKKTEAQREQERLARKALKITKGNKMAAARLLGWSRNKLRWVLNLL